jgi:hypothetical protein
LGNHSGDGKQGATRDFITSAGGCLHAAAKKPSA